MSTFLTALKAEHIKKRGTGLYVMSILSGIFLPVMRGLILVTDKNSSRPTSLHYFLEMIQAQYYPFCSFVFPLLIILVVSRITQLDHRNGGWQLMETQPLSRFSIYFSKFSIVLACQLITILAFILSTLLTGWLLLFFIKIPGGAITSIPVLDILQIASRLFVASLCIAALQYVLSVIIPGFIWSLLIGIAGLLLNLFLLASRISVDGYPYQALSRIALYPDGSDLGHWFVYTDYVSLLSAAVLLYSGYRYYFAKRIKAAFFTPEAPVAQYIASALVLACLLGYTLWPNKMQPNSRTVLSGTLSGSMKFSKVYLVNLALKDTVATIPVIRNAFHYTFKKTLVTDNYTMILDRGFQVPVPVFMGEKDSVFVRITVNSDDSDKKYSGTRIAENQYTAAPYYSEMSYYLDQYLNSPEIYTKYFFRELDQNLEKIGRFKTVDNYTPRSDFNARAKKLVYITYLNHWNNFIKKRTALFPNAKTPIPPRIAELKKEVSLTDESLLSNTDYFDYVIGQLSVNSKEDLSADQKAVKAALTLKPGSFRDKMLYFQLNKNLEEASNTAERKIIIDSYLNDITSPKFRRITLANRALIESLSKGNPAPAFEAITLDNKKFTLADFKGKYLVIDLWATWCGPCKYQSPYFEKFALKYKGKPIRFVSISTDEKFADWYAEAKTKSPSILQLHLNNMFAFAKQYNLQTIPRFILIDPDGKFVNNNLPYPNEQAFELLLRDVIRDKDEPGT